MKKILNLLVLASGTAMAAGQAAPEKTTATKLRSGQEGNGGGGIEQDGRPMTFYSANIEVAKLPLREDEVPELSNLLNFVSELPITANTRGELTSALAPSLQRRYYRATSVSESSRKALINTYAKLFNLSAKKVVLFAITDPSTRNTLLLPEFFALKPSEQKAILLHEGYWILRPKSSYSQVIEVEQYAQRLFETGSDQDLHLLVGRLGYGIDVLELAWSRDIRSGVYEKMFGPQAFSVVKFLGENFIECLKAIAPNDRGVSEDMCFPTLVQHLRDLQRQHGHSGLAQLILEYHQASKFAVYTYRGEVSTEALQNLVPLNKVNEVGGILFVDPTKGQPPTQVQLTSSRGFNYGAFVRHFPRQGLDSHLLPYGALYRGIGIKDSSLIICLTE